MTVSCSAPPDTGVPYLACHGYHELIILYMRISSGEGYICFVLCLKCYQLLRM